MIIKSFMIMLSTGYEVEVHLVTTKNDLSSPFGSPKQILYLLRSPWSEPSTPRSQTDRTNPVSAHGVLRSTVASAVRGDGRGVIIVFLFQLQREDNHLFSSSDFQQRHIHSWPSLSHLITIYLSSRPEPLHPTAHPQYGRKRSGRYLPPQIQSSAEFLYPCVPASHEATLAVSTL